MAIRDAIPIAPNRPEAHANSARLLYMQLPYSTEELKTACNELITANGLPECYLRPIAFYGYGELGVHAREPVAFGRCLAEGFDQHDAGDAEDLLQVRRHRAALTLGTSPGGVGGLAGLAGRQPDQRDHDQDGEGQRPGEGEHQRDEALHCCGCSA